MSFKKFPATATLVDPTTIISPNAATVEIATKYRSIASRIKRQMGKRKHRGRPQVLIDTILQEEDACPDGQQLDQFENCRLFFPRSYSSKPRKYE